MNKVQLIFLLLLVFSCKNPKKSNNEKIQLTEVSEENEINDPDNCIIFVNNFPSNFEDFNRIYGYDDIKGEGVLYSEYEENINNFFSCSGVSNYTKLQKAINIGINGKWDADAVGLFQYKLVDLIKSNHQEALESLNSITKEEASSFWHFLFDGPHPEDNKNKDDVDTLMKLFGKNNAQTLLLKLEYEKLLKKSNR